MARGPRFFQLKVEYDHDSESPMQDTDWELRTFFNNEYVTDVKDRSPYFEPGVGLRRKLSTGTAFWVDRYKHSGTTWGLQGEVHQDLWDTTNTAGILLWNGKAKRLGKTAEERRVAARRILELYTDWAEGSVYWLCLEEILCTDRDFNPELGEDPRDLRHEIQDVESSSNWIGFQEALDGARNLVTRFVPKGSVLYVEGDAAFVVENEELVASPVATAC